ncbi:MAG: cupin domain-containing protein [Lewinella sp.]|nr:cupin domain-containing protein [Lewinella sp.]
MSLTLRLYSLALLFIIVLGCHTARPSANALPDPLTAGWAGQPVCMVLEENTRLRILRCTFAPGVGHERHYHPAHFGYTLAGSRFRILDARGSREVQVLTGTHFYNPGIEWHEVLNIGDSTAVFLLFEPK